MTRPATPEDVAAIQTVEDVRLSPDGRSLAYVLGGETRQPDRERTQLWVAPFEGGEAMRVPGENATSPRWRTGDGQVQLGFLCGRELRVASPADGGEWRVARSWELPAGASAVEWSPDGRHASCVAGRRLMLLDTGTGETCEVAGAGPGVRQYAWSSDGRRVAVVGGGETNARLRVVDVGTGEAREVGEAHDQTIMLAFAPDGRTLAWLGREHAPESTQLELYALDEVGGVVEKRALCGDLAGSIKWVGFLLDGRLLAAVLTQMRVGLFTIDRAAGAVTPLEAGQIADVDQPGSLGTGSFTKFTVSLSADGSKLATTCSGPREPANVVAGKVGEPLRRVTRLNGHLEDVAFGETEYVSWRAEDGLGIHGMLVKPVGYRERRRYPTILEIHGGPRRSWWDTCHLSESWAQLLAGAGYAVLLPNPRGSSGRGPAFVRANTKDLGGADLRDCLAGVDALVERGIADPERLGVCGWSYGGYLTNWCVTQTQRFKAAVSGAGIANFLSWMGQSPEMGQAWGRTHWYQPLVAYKDPEAVLSRSPVVHARHVKTPSLFLHGDVDNKIGAVQAVELHNALKALGVPTELVCYPKGGHQLSDEEERVDSMRRVLAWFEKWLGQGAAAGAAA